MVKENVIDDFCVELKMLVDILEEVLNFLVDKLKEEMGKLCSKVESVLKESCVCLGEISEVIFC